VVKYNKSVKRKLGKDLILLDPYNDNINFLDRKKELGYDISNDIILDKNGFSFQRVDKIRRTTEEILDVLISLELLINGKPTRYNMESFMRMFPDIFGNESISDVDHHFDYLQLNNIITVNDTYVYKGKNFHLLTDVRLYIVTREDVNIYINHGSSGYEIRFFKQYSVEPDFWTKLRRVKKCVNKVSIFEYPKYKIELILDRILHGGM